MTNYSQCYASGDSNTAGSFYFDTIGADDYPASKVLWGAAGAVNHASAATPLPCTSVITGDALTALQLIDNAISGAGFNITQFAGATVPIGAGVEATAVRVTIATDSTGVLSVDDNGGSITVDGTVAVSGTVAVTQSGTWTVQPGNTANTTAWLVTGTGGTFPVTDSGGSLTVDNGGTFAVQIDAGAVTSLALLDDVVFAEDVAAQAADKGVAILAVRRDADTTLVGTDNDYANLQVDANGYLKVEIFDGGGSHTVDNAGTFAVQVDGAALTSLQLIDDAVSGAGFNITQMNGVNVTMGNGASGTGVQRVTLANDSTGIVSLTTSTASIGKLAANAGVTIGAVEIAAAQTLATVTTVTTVTTCSTVTTVSTLTGSAVAHDGVDSGNPHKIGAKATASVLGATPVAAADRTDLFATTEGVLLVQDGSLEDCISERVTNTDGVSTAMTGAFAATASQRIYLTDICIANSSASFCTVDIRDGAAGAVLWTIPVPATGGYTFRFRRPIRFTANTALAYDASAAISTLTISVSGFKSKT